MYPSSFSTLEFQEGSPYEAIKAGKRRILWLKAKETPTSYSLEV